MSLNSQAALAAIRRQLEQADAQRTSEVARIANELQRQCPGLSRTDALKAAERAVPHTI